jgi:hypothetical protein
VSTISGIRNYQVADLARVLKSIYSMDADRCALPPSPWPFSKLRALRSPHHLPPLVLTNLETVWHVHAKKSVSLDPANQLLVAPGAPALHIPYAAPRVRSHIRAVVVIICLFFPQDLLKVNHGRGHRRFALRLDA